MDDLQTNDSQDTELPDTIKNWVTAQDQKQQSIQPPPAVAQMLKAQQPQSPVAPAMDPAAQAQQILQPNGSRMALASHLLHPSVGQTVGNAFAGLGDAIGNAAGGHMNFLDNSMKSQQEKAATMLDAADKDAQMSKDKFALTQQLMKKDPSSDLSKQTQDANMAILQKTLGLPEEAIRKMSAEQIEALGGRPIEMKKAEGEHEVAMEGEKLRGQANVIAANAQATSAKAQSEMEKFHRDQTALEQARLAQEAKNQGLQRVDDAKKLASSNATDVLKETSKFWPGNWGDRNAALKTLNDNAQPAPATPKMGDVVTHSDGSKWQVVGPNLADKNSWKKI